ncbi:hypothetical protein [Bradyrhizobium sp. BR 1432]|uniref:hypothetical protein n=1 Tax=Bradyrhizobium sp. BR 1432 TaxID=3447966 RepID=UPI003EE7B04E
MLDLHGISRAAFDLVIASEVTNQAVYERKYRRVLEPPSDASGPTGGIGYDFGTQTRADRGRLGRQGFARHAQDAVWGRWPAPRKGRGKFAQVPRAGRHPWDVALDVFCNHDLPRYLAILERYCPGAGALSPDCKGVL